MGFYDRRRLLFRRLLLPALGLVLGLGCQAASLAQGFPYTFVNDHRPGSGELLPTGTAQYSPSPPSDNPNGPMCTVLPSFQWDDAFPNGTGISYGPPTSGELFPDTSSADGYGNWSLYKTSDINLSRKTFGHATVFATFLGGDGNYYNPGSQVEADYSLGTTIIAVFSVQVDGTFKPLPGAVVTFGDREHPGYLKTWTTALRTSPTGQKLAWATFGRLISPAPAGDPTNPDQPYPSGLAADMFSIQVSCPGYRPAGGIGDGVQTGLAWVGSALVVNMQSNTTDPSKLSTTTLGGSTPDLPTSKDGTPSPGSGAGTGGSGGSGTGSGAFDPAGFIKSLMDAITSFFTLQQADIDALKSAASQLANWGPFGVPAEIKAQWDNAFGSNELGGGANGSDPNYWVLPLTYQFGAAGSYGSAAPAGYDPKNTPIVSRMPTAFDTMFPKSFDFSPYAGVILTGRFVALVAIWLSVAVGLYRRFTPELRV